MMPKLFLHTCCGPCFLGVWEGTQERFEVTNFFYNPNIQPKEEYQKRLKNLITAAKGKSREVVEVGYDKKEHEKAIIELEQNLPARCLKCYELRLRKTAQEAKKLGFDFFSTTLLVSPYQQHEALKELGNKIAAELDIEFYYADWRKYFRIGQNKAREMDIYRQKYCGCNWSKIESNIKS